jgi:HD domain-containing protein
MSRAQRVMLIAALGLVGASVTAMVFPGYEDLVVLGAALVGSELFELRPVRRAPLPLSFAVVVVLTAATTPVEFAIVVGVGCALGVAFRLEPTSPWQRMLLLAERIAEGYCVRAAYRLVVDIANHADTRVIVLGGLAAASIAPILVADLVTAVREHRIAPPSARGADLALVTSAMLMAVGYAGINGEGRLGLWGPLLFCIPLVAAWYSFELLASTRRSFRQTVSALGAAPELGGLVRVGHVERVAELAVEMGRELDVSAADLEHLETAALLHHLGAVCLDEPVGGAQQDPFEVAKSGASMLRASEALTPAGDIVAAEPSLHRPPGSLPVPAALAGQVLKVASAFDELTEGQDEHTRWAVEALYTGPGYVYDGRVLGALERVLERRGLLTADR